MTKLLSYTCPLVILKHNQLSIGYYNILCMASTTAPTPVTGTTKSMPSLSWSVFILHSKIPASTLVLSFWRETSQSPGTLIVDWPTNDRPTTDQRPTAEELKYSRNRVRRHWFPTNNQLKVWQNSAMFGGRPICAAVEALLTLVVNWQWCVFYLASA